MMGPRYTAEELEARLKFTAGIVLIVVFGSSMLAIIWSLIFNVQPMNGIAPADKQFFELLKTMVTFLAGVISTIVTNRLVTKKESTSPTLSTPDKPITKPVENHTDGQAARNSQSRST